MRRLVFLRIICITLGLVVGAFAQAQIDPSSALLLNGDSSDGGVSGTALDSGRYTIRPKTDATPIPAKASRKSAVKTESADAVPVTISVPSQPTPTPTESSQPTTVIVPVTERKTKNATTAVRPDDSMSRVVHVDGRRSNILELSVAPGYLYNNSDSFYSYRTYSLAAPTLGVEANVWISSMFGLHGNYLTTFDASVSDANTGSRNVPVSETWLTLGLRMREFYGADALAPSISFGLDYLNFAMQTSASAKTRESLSTSGVQLSIDADMPVSFARAWTVGLTFAPILAHSEGSTGINFQSGTGVSSASVSLSLGNRIQFSKSDAIFWKISQTIEKDLFSGAATVADPVTGYAPTNVSVTNSFSILQVGYTWGD